MENSKPLATESFSYSWLVERKPHSSEKATEKDQNFHFDVPFTSSSHVSLVHADEIFSDGHIMPLYLQTSLKSSTSVPPSPVSSANPFVISKKQGFLLRRWRNSSKRMLSKCFGLVIKPLCQPIWCSRKSSRVDDLERKVSEVRSWSNSVEASPRRSCSVVDWCRDDGNRISKKDDVFHGFKRVKSLGSSPYASPRISPSRSSNAWCVDESSIHEAILYCKRSIEK